MRTHDQLEEHMSRNENESKSDEASREQQQPIRQPLPTPKAQQFESALRRPQNFDDWETRRREDDPTR
jgi:hypothetical protein